MNGGETGVELSRARSTSQVGPPTGTRSVSDLVANRASSYVTADDPTPLKRATRNTGTNPRNPFTLGAALTELAIQHIRLIHANCTAQTSILGEADANVSLTSFGKRISTVWQTIETIGAGRTRPRRLILWLDDAEALSDLPPSLRRLQARGLEILPCLNYGPHKKYFPYVNDILPSEPGRTLVTADDDVLYPANWLKDLLHEHRPNQVTQFPTLRSAMTTMMAVTPSMWTASWALWLTVIGLLTTAVGVTGAVISFRRLALIGAVGSAYAATVIITTVMLSD